MRRVTTALDRAAHCRQPEACAAKGAGLCSPCFGARQNAINRADPAWRAAHVARVIASTRDPATNAKRTASRRANPAAMAELRVSGRRRAAIMNSDPDIQQRRVDRLRAATPGQTQRQAERLARDVSIPVEFVREYRALRRNRFSKEEARGVLARSHPEAFRNIHAAERSAIVRAAGPQPAPGTEQRRAWTARVADGETRP